MLCILEETYTTNDYLFLQTRNYFFCMESIDKRNHWYSQIPFMWTPMRIMATRIRDKVVPFR